MTRRGNRLIFVLIAVFVIFTIAFVATSSFAANAASNVIVISSQGDFENFARDYNNYSGTLQNTVIKLYTDVDMRGVNFYMSSFRGTLEGNGHKITHITKPLFGTISAYSSYKGKIVDLDLVFDDATGLANINQGELVGVGMFGTLNCGSAFSAAPIMENYGTISGCVNACGYSSTRVENNFAGFAINNSGTVTDCVFVGDFSVEIKSNHRYYISGLTLDSTGTVTDCTVGGNILALNSMAVEGINVYAFGRSGTYENCSAYLAFSDLSLADFTIDGQYFGIGTVTDAATADNSFVIYTDGADADEDGDIDVGARYYVSGVLTVASDVNELVTGNKFGTDYFYDGKYPLSKAVFEGNGRVTPFVIACRKDMSKMRISGICDDYEYALGADINLYDMPLLPAMAQYPYTSGNVNMNGRSYAFIGCGNDTVFDPVYSIDGYAVGILNSDTDTLTGNTGDGYCDDDYPTMDFGGGSTVFIDASSVDISDMTGSGTAADPYIVTSAAELQAVAGIQDAYAVLDRDILLNSAELDDPKKFNIPIFEINLEGNGHSIIGLLNKLCGTLNGTVRNLRLRGKNTVNTIGDKTLLCSVNNGYVIDCVAMGSAWNGFAESNGGTIAGCVFYGVASLAAFTYDNTGDISGCTNYGNCVYAFAGVNRGIVQLSENYGEVTYVFDVASAEGMVINSVNYGRAAPASASGVETSIDFYNDNAYAGGECRAGETTYYYLKDLGFDFESIFGCPVGTDGAELRHPNVAYRTGLYAPFRTISDLQKTYTGDVFYSPSELIDDLATAETAGNILLTINYNGEEYSSDTTPAEGEFNGEIKDSGSYAVTAYYDGADAHLPAWDEFTIIVRKAEKPENMLFAAGVFDENVHVAYDGRVHVLEVPQPSNLAILQSYGYSAPEYKAGSQTTYRDVGTYVRRVIMRADNYEDIEVERGLYVDKVDLKVQIGSGECAYGETVDFATAIGATIISGLKGNDLESNLTLGDLFTAEEYAAGFRCDYNAGVSPAGSSYRVNFIGTAKNYDLKVTAGTLTVIKADFSTADIANIDFYGSTSALPTAGATVSRTYTSEPIALAASVTAGQGISVFYRDEEDAVYYDGYSVTEAGDYTVYAVFGKGSNYNTYTLCAVLTVNPAVLTVTAEAVQVPYGTPTPNGYSVKYIGLLGSDGAEGITPSFTLKDGATAIPVGTTDLSVKDYTIEVTYSGELSNYSVVTAPAVYTVTKASLTALYNNNTASNTDFADLTQEYNGSEIVREVTYFTAAQASVAYSLKFNGTPVADGYPIKSVGVYEKTATVTPIGDYATKYDTTTYVCTVTVTKRAPELRFTRELYEYPYANIDYADIGYFEYESELEPEFSCEEGAAISKGTYTVKLYLAETADTAEKTVSATLHITQKALSLTYQREYEYSGTHIVPIMTADSIGLIGTDTTDFTYTYYVYSNNDYRVIEYIQDRGDKYYFTVTATNLNYDAGDDYIPLTVLRKSLYIDWGTVEFDYGTHGSQFIGGNSYEIGSGFIIRKNWRLEGLSMPFDVTVAINSGAPANKYDYADTYVITDDDIATVGNYQFRLTEGTHSVKIKPRDLNVIWVYGDEEIPSARYAVEYAGTSLLWKVEYSILNLPDGVKKDDLNYSLKVNGNENSDIYHCGDYTLTLGLIDSPDYNLIADPFVLKVEKVQLRILVKNDTVEQYEAYTRLNYQILGGRRGQDASKDLNALYRNSGLGPQYGKRSEYDTGYAYDPFGAVVGDVYYIKMIPDFGDYTASVEYESGTEKGATLTVVPNRYPDYTLSDVKCTYDGEYHTVTLAVADEVQVTMSDNCSQREVGVYTVEAVIRYPSGREKKTNCRLEIVAARPILVMDKHETVYIEGKILADSFIRGKAYLDEAQTKELAGEFIFVGDGVLKEGTAEYPFRFVPVDTHNINANFGEPPMLTVTAPKITMANFTFDKPQDITFDDSGERITVTSVVTMTFNSPIEGLALYRQGYRVDNVVFGSTETVTVEVKEGEEVGFSVTFNVVRITEEVEDIVFNVGALALDGEVLTSKTVYVKSGGGRLTLAESYKNDYNLYINEYLLDEYIITGNEGELSVVIRLKSVNAIVYTVTLTVEAAPEVKPEKKSNTLYYVLGGVGGGVVVIVAVFLIIWKKKNG